MNDIIGIPIEIGAEVVFTSDGKLLIGTVVELTPLTVDYLNNQIEVSEVYIIDYMDEEVDTDVWPDVCLMEEY